MNKARSTQNTARAARWKRIAIEGALLAIAYLVLVALLHRANVEEMLASTLSVLGTLGLWAILRAQEKPESVTPEETGVTEAPKLEPRVDHREKMKSLGVLASSFAHELEDPLASLSAELEMLDLSGNMEQMKESVVVLRQHTGRMTRTVRGMVDFAQRQRHHVASAFLPNAVADAVRLAHEDARARATSIVIDLAPSLPEVPLKESDLVLLLETLIARGIDAMHEEGGTIAINARACARGVELVVRDDGSSPPSAARSSLCYAVATEIGGALELTSDGSGTTARVVLPASS